MKSRRQVRLTLGRGEWYLIVRQLATLPQTAEICKLAIATLQVQLGETEGNPSQMLTISQPPLNWSPLIFGLSLHVLLTPTLLPLAERLRSQMEMQTKRIEGAVRMEDPSEADLWEKAPVDDWREIATAN